MSQHWALLADPEDYGWNELRRDGKVTWDGVKNAVAQRHMKSCAVGDTALLYHTAPDKAVMGIVRISKAAAPDPKNAERVVLEVQPVQPLAQPLSLSDMKADATLSEMSFVRMPRVAVQPVTAAQWKQVLALSGTKEKKS